MGVERWWAVAAQLPAPEVPAGEAVRTAREILSRAEYRQPEPSLIDRAWNWLWEQVARVLEAVGGAAGGYGVGIALLVVMLLVAGWSLYRVMPRSWSRRARPTAPAVQVEALTGLSRRQLLDLAARAEAEGRWADAVAHRYRALVQGLAEQRALPDDPASTPGELRQAFRGDPAEQATFQRASTCYELVRYRGDPAGPEEGRRLSEWDRQLVGGAG